MSTTPRIIADFETQLASAIAPAGTSFEISSNLDDDGNAIPNGAYCFTLDNGTSVKEYLFGDLVGTTVSNVKSVSRQGVKTTGAARTHRVGASVILTDFTAIQIVADLLAGRDTLDGSTPLSYDIDPTLTDGKQLATVQYVLDLVSGGTVRFNIQSIQMTAGESVASPNIGYLKESDQRIWKSDIDDSATYGAVELGVVGSTATAGQGVIFQRSGVIGGFSGMTPGAKQYLSSSAGGITETPTAQFLGVAITASTMFFNPARIYIPSKNEKDAMAGGTGFGTPSSSNKFLTEESPDSTTIFPLPVVRTYTTNSTWSKPAGLKYVVVELVGSGGGGGSGAGTDGSGGGGGGGGYSKKTIAAASLGATEAVTIGLGGSAGSSSDGGNGNTTSFGSHLQATGGSGGGRGQQSAGNAGGAGGVGSNGDINLKGDGGASGYSDAGSTSALVGSGKGGSSLLGGGAEGAGTNGSTGSTGGNYGGGGSGGYSGNGGAGAPGFVIVTEHYF